MNRFVRFTLSNRWLVLMVCAAITVTAGAVTTSGVIASSIGGLFLGEHPDYPRYIERTKDFGSDDLIVVALEEPAVLSQRARRRLDGAVKAIEKLPAVQDVRSVLRVQQIRESEGSVIIERYATLARGNPAEEARLLQKLRKDPFARDLFISRDGRHTAVVVELSTDPSRPAEKSPELVRQIVKSFQSAGYARDQIHVVGLSANVATIIEETHQNIQLRFPMVVVMLLVAVWLMFRRLWPVLVTGVVALTAVVWTMGFAILIDRNVSVFTGLVPAVIMIIAFSDVVHLCSAYLLELDQGRSKDEAIRAAGSEVGSACVFTSVTTFVGFVSLSLVPTPASRQLGLVLGFGAGIALLIAVTVAPILFSLLPRPEPWRRGATGRVQDLLDRFLRWAGRITSQRPVAVVALFVALAVVIGVGLSRLTIETDFTRRMAEDHPLRQDGRYFREYFAGSNTLLLFLESPKEQGLLDSQTFAGIVRFQRALERFPEVDRATSLVDLVQKLHRTLVPEEERAEAREKPLSRQALAQYLLLFEMSGGEELDRLVDFTRRTMVMRLQLKGEDFRQTGEVGERALNLARRTLGERVRVEASGLTYLLGQFFNVILEEQKRALLLVFIVIAVMMCIGLRSVRVGLWSMIPNLLPLATLGGYLGLACDYVDSDVLIVSMIAIGIGVDDTIHFLMRFRIESQRQKDASTAIARTFAYSGRGIVITTVILVLGFSPFALSDYLSIYFLGTLLPLTLVVALVADLFLVPALVKLGMISYPEPSLRPGR
jgi:predicted RND superfamily exporter protein